MSNEWIEHVKKIARENNMTYGCAISDPRCKASYKPKHKIVTKFPTDVPKKLTKEEREEHLNKLRKKRDEFVYKGTPPTIS